MSELLEFVLDLLLNLVASLLEGWFGAIDWPDTWASSIFWGGIILALGGMLWWELR